MLSVRQLLIDLAILVTAAAVLAALGPFGTYGIGDFAPRLAYWLPATLAGYAFFRPAGALADWLGERLRLHRWAAMVAAVLIAAWPAAVVIALLQGIRLGEIASPVTLFPLYLNVALIGALVMALFVILQPGRTPAVGPVATPTAAQPPTEAPRAAFLDRLPPGFPPLIALEMEDHYVRAHGRGGRSALILMRMRDAVAELGETDGERVHRSWWVARDALVGSRRAGRNLMLKLDGGLEAPVARDRVAMLREKRWL